LLGLLGAAFVRAESRGFASSNICYIRNEYAYRNVSVGLFLKRMVLFWDAFGPAAAEKDQELILRQS
jgi:hypothetical protein